MAYLGKICAAMLVLAVAMPTRADPVVRNGDIWDGRDHDPNPATVHQEERAAGILPSRQREEQLDEEVERTARELLDHPPDPMAAGRVAGSRYGE
jgi:hypothetical protein